MTKTLEIMGMQKELDIQLLKSEDGTAVVKAAKMGAKAKEIAEKITPGPANWDNHEYENKALNRYNMFTMLTQGAFLTPDLAIALLNHPDQQVQAKIDDIAVKQKLAIIYGLIKPPWIAGIIEMD